MSPTSLQRWGAETGARARGLAGGGVNCKWAQRILPGGQNILQLDCGVGYAACQTVKAIELYTANGRIGENINDSSTKLLKKRTLWLI